jgi:hypothetical protein
MIMIKRKHPELNNPKPLEKLNKMIPSPKKE